MADEIDYDAIIDEVEGKKPVPKAPPVDDTDDLGARLAPPPGGRTTGGKPKTTGAAPGGTEGKPKTTGAAVPDATAVPVDPETAAYAKKMLSRLSADEAIDELDGRRVPGGATVGPGFLPDTPRAPSEAAALWSQRLIREGVAPAEAHRRAALAMSNPEAIDEEIRRVVQASRRLDPDLLGGEAYGTPQLVPPNRPLTTAEKLSWLVSPTPRPPPPRSLGDEIADVARGAKDLARWALTEPRPAVGMADVRRAQDRAPEGAEQERQWATWRASVLDAAKKAGHPDPEAVATAAEWAISNRVPGITFGTATRFAAEDPQALVDAVAASMGR